MAMAVHETICLWIFEFVVPLPKFYQEISEWIDVEEEGVWHRKLYMRFLQKVYKVDVCS